MFAWSHDGSARSVCTSCFVILSNLLSLHPTLAYQGMARGETDHGGGWYALVSLNYTTPGPWLILAQWITANISNGTDAHGGITTNMVQLTFSQGWLWPVKEAQARSSAHDGPHSPAICVPLSSVDSLLVLPARACFFFCLLKVSSDFAWSLVVRFNLGSCNLTTTAAGVEKQSFMVMISPQTNKQEHVYISKRTDGEPLETGQGVR